MKTNYHKTIQFIKQDWRSNPVRLCFETINWLLNLTIASIVSFTVPNTNWFLIYPIIFCAISISIYSSISRGSFGILLTSSTLLIIDVIGYWRLLAI
jgi:hypothetical protein